MLQLSNIIAFRIFKAWHEASAALGLVACNSVFYLGSRMSFECRTARCVAYLAPLSFLLYTNFHTEIFVAKLNRVSQVSGCIQRH